MEAKIIIDKIDELLANSELSTDLKEKLVDLRDSIKQNKNKKEAKDIALKWITLFKEALHMYSIFQNLF